MTMKPCTMMSTYYAGCLAKAGAKSRWQSSFTRRSWLPSRSTPGFSGHPSSRQDSRCIGQPKIPGPIFPKLLLLLTKRPMRRWWHMQGRPNNEPLLQLWSVRKGWWLHWLPMLCKPQEVQILWTVRTKFSGNLMPWVNWRKPRCIPGNFMPKGHHKGRTNQVTQLHKMEILGDIHQRKGTSAGNERGRPEVQGRRMPAWHWDAGGLPVAPSIMLRRISNQLIQHCSILWIRYGDGGRPKPPQLRMWTLSAHHNLSPISSDSWSRKSPLWQVLMQETASFCHHHWCHHHHHHCCHLLRIQSPPPVCSQMDRVACQVYPDSILVGRVDSSPRPHRLSGVCPEGVCLLWGTCSMQLGKEGGESLHATSSAPLYWQTSLSTIEGCEVHQPWHLPQSGTAYHSLHDGFAVLGQVGASPSPWPTSSSCGEHAGTVIGNGTACFFWGVRGLCAHSSPTGWKLPCHSQQRPCCSLHRNPRSVTPITPGLFQESPWSWPGVRTALLPLPHRLLQQQRHWWLHHGSLDHTSICLTPSTYAHHWDSQKLPRHWGQKSLWKAAHHQSSPASQHKRPLTPMRAWGWLWQCPDCSGTKPQGRCWWMSRSALKESWARGSTPRKRRWQMSDLPWPSRNFLIWQLNSLFCHLAFIWKHYSVFIWWICHDISLLYYDILCCCIKLHVIVILCHV